MAKAPSAKPTQDTPGSTTATLEMVAVEACVSPSTVSRFLNGTARVSDAKRHAIETAINKLNFVADPFASGLAGGKTRCIGVITQTISSPFFGQGLMGIEDVLLEQNYAALFVSSHFREEDERRCLAFLEARRVDGIIILTSCLPDEVLLGQSARMPLVITGRDLETGQLRSLNFDNFEGARLATEHLIALGHREIAFLKGAANHPDANERLRGYRAALRAHGLPFRPGLAVQGHFLESGGEAAVTSLLARGESFSAVFAANDQMAYGAMLALHGRGLKVPRDVSVIGFDDLPGSAFTWPPLTTVRHSIYEIGKLAAQALVDMIAGREHHPRAPRPELQVRASARPPRKKARD